MPTIRLNGRDHSVAEGESLAELVGSLDLDRGGVAIEINRTIVPRSQYGQRVLVADDRVEIVTIMGGG